MGHVHEEIGDLRLVFGRDYFEVLLQGLLDPIAEVLVILLVVFDTEELIEVFKIGIGIDAVVVFQPVKLRIFMVLFGFQVGAVGTGRLLLFLGRGFVWFFH